jgi:hypothetical protein
MCLNAAESWRDPITRAAQWQQLSSYNYEIFLSLQGPDGKLTARSGAGCEATRQWPGTNRLDGRR